MEPPGRIPRPALGKPSSRPKLAATPSTSTSDVVFQPMSSDSDVLMTSPRDDGPPSGRKALESLAPHTTLAQLSYAPATQTTVVTTTTTTTTALPPLILQAPRHLDRLDPKKYPLATSETPPSLRNISFEYNGVTTRFCEADDASQSLRKVSRHRLLLVPSFLQGVGFQPD